MTLYDRRKKQLFEELKDKEYRDAFVEESINVGIPFQIKALREQRELKQKDLEQFGMKQSLISRLENPNYEGFSLSTLKKIASIFDIGLIVRFVAISELVEWDLNLNSDSLKVLSYEDDPYFKEEPEEISSGLSNLNEPYLLGGNKNIINFDEYREQNKSLSKFDIERKIEGNSKSLLAG